MRPSLVVLLIALVAGCKSREPAPAAVSPPDLQLVSAGSEPRRALRYQPAVGTTQKLEVAVDVELEAGDMGGPMPTLVFAMTVSVEALLPTGDMRVRAVVDDAHAREREGSTVPAVAVTGSIAVLQGLALEAQLSPIGRLTGARVDTTSKPLPADVEAQVASLVASFESTMMPLPVEPVGIGAVWRNSRALTTNGMSLTAVNAVTLTGATGTSITFALDTDVHGKDQTVSQAGISIEIKDLVGTGSGTGTIDLTTLAVTSELTSQLRSVMSAPGDTEPTKMTMTTVSRVRPLAGAQGAQSAP